MAIQSRGITSSVSSAPSSRAGDNLSLQIKITFTNYHLSTTAKKRTKIHFINHSHAPCRFRGISSSVVYPYQCHFSPFFSAWRAVEAEGNCLVWKDADAGSVRGEMKLGSTGDCSPTCGFNHFIPAFLEAAIC